MRFTSGGGWCSGLIGAFVLLASCGPKYPRAPADKAVLVGMREDREAHGGKSSVRGTIRRLDGRTVKLTKEEHVDPGCHVLEVEVEYTIVRPDTEPDPSCALFDASFDTCKRRANYESGRRHFAIAMRPGHRYELSARINEEGAWVYFVEVDPEIGTVARFTPVYPGTACLPGIAF